MPRLPLLLSLLAALVLAVPLLAGCAGDPVKARRAKMHEVAVAATAAGLRGDPAELPAEMLAAVVQVDRAGTHGDYCTGVLVAPDLVATAAHCLQDLPASGLSFRLVDGTRRQGVAIVGQGGVITGRTILLGRSAADWALIRVASFERPGLAIKTMRPTEVTNAARAGETVLAAGYHAGRLQAIGPCPLKPLWEFGFFETACPVAPGDSGGPVVLLTPDGPRLIGLLSAGRDGMTFAVSTLQFAELLQH